MPTVNDIFPGNYIRAADLNNQEVEAVIERVEFEEMETDKGKVKKPVIYFQGGQKGLVANKTNCVSIEHITGESDTDNWPGHKIVLFSMPVQFGSKLVDAIRIKSPASGSGYREVPNAAAEPAPEKGLNDPIPF